ncbi:MAG: 3-deoxy-manno-octulosonate cytidylyltransferase [Pseudomonadota bacterium]|nr:3-deoxy-manno-octulosonate cytidylyltransferase [Pseudomonadota bacterium]
MKRSVCIIPARMGSSRFPGKPMATLLDMPMILHIYKRCCLYDGFDRVVVATCDEEIHDTVAAEGGEAVMTADTHKRCTDRTEEAIANLGLELRGDDLVLMVQGDEVLVSPDLLAEMVEVYRRDRPQVVNLISRIFRKEDQDDPNTVKVVSALNDQALYFSRAAIPSRARANSAPVYQQTGVIGFSAKFLAQFSRLEPTPLEIIESVDMMRILEHGYAVQLVRTESETIGVDTPADLTRAEKILAEDPATERYLQTS